LSTHTIFSHQYLNCSSILQLKKLKQNVNPINKTQIDKKQFIATLMQLILLSGEHSLYQAAEFHSRFPAIRDTLYSQQDPGDQVKLLYFHPNSLAACNT
jgi:hypothetical protein